MSISNLHEIPSNSSRIETETLCTSLKEGTIIKN
jgi:hypothetical protein